MQIVEIQGKKWMIGVEWEILPGDAAPKVEVKEIAEKTGNKFGVLIEFEETYSVGLTNKIDRKAPSAALTLAIANQDSRESKDDTDFPDWIVLEEVGEERYWMAVIKSGIPAPQFDEILSITDIKDRMTELLINDTYQVFTTSQELISIFEGFKSITAKGLNDLTQETEVPNKFEKLLGIPNSVIYTGFGLLAFGAVIWGGLLLVEGRSLKEKAEYFQRQAEEENRIKQQKYTQALESYERDLRVKKENALNDVVLGISGNTSKIINAFYENIGGTEIGTHGWDLTNIECYFDSLPPRPSKNNPAGSEDISKLMDEVKSKVFPRIFCDYAYKRTGYNTTRMFLTDYPNAKLTGSIGIVSKPVEIAKEYIVKTDSEILNDLPNAKKFGFDIQSQLQLMGITGVEHKILASEELSYEVPGKPMQPNTADSPIQFEPASLQKLGFSVGEIVVYGRGLELLRELADNVDFSGTVVRKVSLKPGNILEDMQWTATFNYYINNSDGGTIGESSNISKDTRPKQQENINVITNN